MKALIKNWSTIQSVLWHSNMCTYENGNRKASLKKYYNVNCTYMPIIFTLVLKGTLTEYYKSNRGTHKK